MRFFLSWLRRYLVIRRAWRIIRNDGSKYRLLKCEVALRKLLRDEALDRWSRCDVEDSNADLFNAMLQDRRFEYYQAVSDLLAWRLGYKRSGRS